MTASPFAAFCPDCQTAPLGVHEPGCLSELAGIHDDDRQWFIDHPGELTRIRRILNNEITLWGYRGAVVFDASYIYVSWPADNRSLLWYRWQTAA
jgi:hypothetical protein